MILQPSPAYHATCSSGEASAQRPGLANPFGPPSPQLKSMQKALMDSEACAPPGAYCSPKRAIPQRAQTSVPVAEPRASGVMLIFTASPAVGAGQFGNL